jgi:proteasome lid subunit RPN8/RPN11
MKKSGAGKPSAEKPLTLQVASDVIREIRQHAHSLSTAEICGVLLGNHADGVTSITAAIAGANAEQGGAHVTFTQETWAHIFKIKDLDYPDHRILGWYHSHPGFGIFLSDHDTFIHRNFFSDPHQIAWVCDPHSDEEGCFGWSGERIERLPRFTVTDDRGGELADESGRPEPIFGDAHPSIAVTDGELTSQMESSSKRPLEQILVKVLSHAVALLLGLAFAWYVMPRVILVPIPVDPQTGVPLKTHSPAVTGSAGAQKGGTDDVR